MKVHVPQKGTILSKLQSSHRRRSFAFGDPNEFLQGSTKCMSGREAETSPAEDLDSRAARLIERAGNRSHNGKGLHAITPRRSIF